MSSPTAEDVIEAFVTIVRERLERGESVTVPGLGTFSVEHQPSEQKERPDGSTYMAPPQNVVVFDPDE